MSDNLENADDIVAELRSEGQLSLANRVEAAAKRERAFHAMTEEANERLREHLAIALKGDVGNSAAMREALKLCGSQMCKLCKDLTLARSMINKGLMGVSCHPDKCKPFQAVHDALAAPPRNCDVGTEEEQQKRFDQFCYRYRNYENCCGDCPASGFCELSWAQMPYEFHGGGGFASADTEKQKGENK